MAWPLDERRATLRCDFLIKVQIELPEDFTDDPVFQHRRHAFTRNIGLEGVLIVSSIPIPPGTRLRIWIPFYVSGKTLELTGEVVQCERTVSGHEVALKFVETNPIADSLILQYVGTQWNKA